MLSTEAKELSRDANVRTVPKKTPNDSGIGKPASSDLCPQTPQQEPSNRRVRHVPVSFASSPARSTRGIYSSTLPSTGSTPNDAARSSFEQFSRYRAPQLVAPMKLGQPSNSGHGQVRRVESWLEEQQRINNTDDNARVQIPKASGTPCNPYLAYPGLPKSTSWRQNVDRNDDILSSFVIVEEEGSEKQSLGRSGHVDTCEHHADGFLSTSSTSCSSSARHPSSRPPSILSISSWRHPFNKSLPTRRHPSTTGEHIDLSTPPASIWVGSARRRSPIPENFYINEVGTSAQSKSSSSTLKAPKTSSSSVRRRLESFMRPSTGFNTSPHSKISTKSTSSPRPSTSASTTTATTSTAVENEHLSVAGDSSKRFLSKFSLNLTKATRHPPEDVRLDSPTRSSFSTTLQNEEPDNACPLPYQSFSHLERRATPTLAKRRSQPSIFRDKRHNASSSALSTLSIGSIGTIASNINGRASSVLSRPSTAKRKRLVVSGIAPDDTLALQGLRKWCERFGELRHITRMPNEDLVIDFKRADVADTVCRISARVYIAEVGSVNVSWISGKRY